MSILATNKTRKQLRQRRVRARVFGTAERPRMCVTISNSNVSVQIINDEKASTIVAATSIGQKLKGTLTDKAIVIGTEIAVKAKKHKISKVVFDRGGRLYHGRIKALADAARKEGLEF